MEELITIYTFANSFEAEIVKGKLNSEGIAAFLIDENTNYTIGPTIIEGVRLQVRQEDYQKAKDIIKKTLQEE